MTNTPGLRATGATGRRTRRPLHPFNIQHRPWQITPFCLAPVLPGDTMKNILLQSRVVTDPIKDPLVGWWIEHYFFYVKHRDLEGRDDFQAMMLELDKDMSSYKASVKSVQWYEGAGSMRWLKLCYDRIVATYFRDEDEVGLFNWGGYDTARINQNSWMDSLVDEDVYTAGSDVEIEVGVDDVITAGEIDEAMRTYMFMREHQMTDMSYEDYLATYGIRPRPEEFHRPELLRYSREWSYPTNHIDPTNGAPSSALSWAVAERADKDRFFREPGFIVGLTVARPKVYLTRQTSSLTGVMADALSWLPAILSDDPNSSLRHHVATAEPLGDSADGYWYDLKDLFSYGEQFVNYAINTATAALPPTANAGLWRYPTAADADALFSGTGKNVRQDGQTALTILSRIVDTTPQGIQG